MTLDRPSYLPEWPTTWPDTPDEAAKVIAAMQPRPSKRAVVVALAALATPVAIVTIFFPQMLAFLALLIAIAIGAGGARMKHPFPDWRRR